MIKAFLKKVGLLSKRDDSTIQNRPPQIIERKHHTISRNHISEAALKVLYRLNKYGYQAYLVGGGVRDLLLGLHPKDFDVVTNAKPEEVRQIFRNCRLIGRRFRLAHVYFGSDIIEVATFRGKSDLNDSKASLHSEHGMILRDNVYGTMDEDVWRRDFTINALYYNIADFSVVDYSGGFEDLKAKKVKMIGDVHQRFREDPVRMLRAIRIACKVKFPLTQELTQPIKELKSLLHNVSPSRLFEELLKLFHSGVAHEGYALLKQHHLFEEIFPMTAALFDQDYPSDALLKVTFLNTDKRLEMNKPVTPAFIIAALLWYPICEKTKEYQNEGLNFSLARQQAAEFILQEQLKKLSIPKRFTQGAREIWLLQSRFINAQPKRVERLITHPRFRAAYDFFLLRAQAGENIGHHATWWQQFVEADEEQRSNIIKQTFSQKKPRRRKKKTVDSDKK